MLDMNSNSGMSDTTKDELKAMRQTLKKGLEEGLAMLRKKLTPQQLKSLTDEVDSVEELLVRLETGYVWIALFGKVNVGKSSIGNSLLNRYAFEESPLYDTTVQCKEELLQPLDPQ